MKNEEYEVKWKMKNTFLGGDAGAAFTAALAAAFTAAFGAAIFLGFCTPAFFADCKAAFALTTAAVGMTNLFPSFFFSSSGWIFGITPPAGMVTFLRSWNKT